MADSLQDIRQRRIPLAGDAEQRALSPRYLQAPGAGFLTFPGAQVNPATGFRGFAAADVGQGRVGTREPLHQHFQLAAGFLLAPQACGDDPGVVEDQQVVGAEKVDKFGEAVMTDLTRGTIQAQQTAVAAPGQGVLGDQFGGQVV